MKEEIKKEEVYKAIDVMNKEFENVVGRFLYHISWALQDANWGIEDPYMEVEDIQKSMEKFIKAWSEIKMGYNN